MKPSYLNIKNLLVIIFLSIGLVGFLMSESGISLSALAFGILIFFTGRQVQLNPGFSFSYTTDTEKVTGRTLAMIRAVIAVTFMTAALGGYNKQEYGLANLIASLAIALYSPVASLIFYNGGYITRTEQEYNSVKKFHYWFLFARNTGIILLVIAIMMKTQEYDTVTRSLFITGAALLLSVPFLLLIKRKLLVTSPSLLHLLLGKPTQLAASVSFPVTPVPAVITTATSIQPATDSLLDEFKQLEVLQPQQRGYAFQRFLIRLFTESGLDARAAFRVVGEEIDGSFELDGNIYLLEAKWQQSPCSGSPLRDFNGKVEGKASWARGIIVCYAGFSEEAVKGFVTGKRLNIIGMDGKDIEEILKGKMHLKEAIKRKVRLAGERNSFFMPVKDLL